MNRSHTKRHRPRVEYQRVATSGLELGPRMEALHRNQFLAGLGYDSYRAYLDSPLWHSIRERVLDAADGQCYGCGHRATQVHHVAYTRANLLGESLEHLTAICKDCHDRFRGHSGDATRKRLEVARRKRLPAFCPACQNNRSFQNGPCPPCRRLNA